MYVNREPEITTFVVDLTPKTHGLDAKKNANLGWVNALSELIDNSFDAGATHVSIKVLPKTNKNEGQVSVTDNGIGISDFNVVLAEGASVPHKKLPKGLGRYGVGLKDAVTWLWGTTTIKTNSGNGDKFIRIDWDKLMKGASWKLDCHSYINQSDETERMTGTSIECNYIQQRWKNTENVIEQLSYMFSPAIMQGKQIELSVKDKVYPIKLFKIPDMTNVIQKTVQVSHGKSYQITAGVVAENEINNRPGHTIAYKHRVIVASKEGCGDFNTSRFFSMVYLIGNWNLSRNKTSLSHTMEALNNSLYETCKDILGIASSAGKSYENLALQKSISDKLSKILGEGTATRKRANRKKGNINPVGIGRIVKQAEIIRAGVGKIKGPCSGKVIVNLDAFDDLTSIGNCHPGKNGSFVIDLNTNNVFVNAFQKNEQVIEMLALMILSCEQASITTGSKNEIRGLQHIERTGKYEHELVIEFLGALLEKSSSINKKENQNGIA